MAFECATDQLTVTYEPLSKEMAPHALLEVHEAMSPAARYMRYLSATPRLTDSMLQRLSDIDGARHIAWRAICGARTVGLVRLHTDRDGVPELAVEVVDDHTGMGIGRGLMSVALGHAAAVGADALRILVHPENTPAIRLFRATGARFTFEAGLLEGTIPVVRSSLAA